MGSAYSIVGLNEGVVDSDDVNVASSDAIKSSLVSIVIQTDVLIHVFHGVIKFISQTRSHSRVTEDLDELLVTWDQFTAAETKGELTIRPIRPKPLIPTWGTIVVI